MSAAIRSSLRLRLAPVSLLLCALALGFASRRVHLGVELWDKSLGDVLYAVAMFFGLALLWPRVRPAVTGAIAFAACFAIEIFQLTGIPLALAVTPRWGFTRWILGTTFAWHDVGCYAGGVLIAAALASATSVLFR
jgi:hypothetical protein